MAWRDIWQKHRETVARAVAGPNIDQAILGETGVEVLERKPTHSSKLLPAVDTNVMAADQIAEYRSVCEATGVDERDIVVEEFRVFLARLDLPTFNLQEVIQYMDALTARDNPTGFGWQWCPVRPKDTKTPLRFGKMSELHHVGRSMPENPAAASDFYQSHEFVEKNYEAYHEYRLERGFDARIHPSPVYTRTLPIHALKKIALIEKEWKGTTAPIFLVTDYTLRPHRQTWTRDVTVNPDPFLMAVIPNSAVAFGKGRFVIDVWDEPGFGIAQMLK